MANPPAISSIQQKNANETPEVQVVRQFLNALDAKQALPTELTAPNLVFTFNSDKPTDVAGWQGLIQQWYTAFPGSKHTVESCEGVGNRVFARIRATGTHKGPLFGIPASGKPMDIIGNVQFTVEGGKLTRAAPVWDMLTLMQQVGAVPKP